LRCVRLTTEPLGYATMVLLDRRSAFVFVDDVGCSTITQRQQRPQCTQRYWSNSSNEISSIAASRCPPQPLYRHLHRPSSIHPSILRPAFFSRMYRIPSPSSRALPQRQRPSLLVLLDVFRTSLILGRTLKPTTSDRPTRRPQPWPVPDRPASRPMASKPVRLA